MRRLLFLMWTAAALPGALSARPATAQARSPAQAARAVAEPPQVTRSLEALDELLTAYLQSMPRDRNHPGRPGAARALDAVTRLRRLSVKWPAQSPLDYRTNLARSVQNLESLIRAADTSKAAAVTRALAEDLEVKLEHCLKSGGRLGGSVNVQVRTLRRGEEVRHWQVFYLPRVLELLGDQSADRFPQLSSPTNERIVPGRYVMWTSDPASGREGRKTTVKVGEGRQHVTIDLTVPGS
jgi:hypothetical protein